MIEFKVGNRVISVADYPAGNMDIIVGSAGVICALADVGLRLGVRWDDEIRGGHNLHGEISDFRGWWVSYRDVILESDDKPFEFDEEEFNKLVFGQG